MINASGTLTVVKLGITGLMGDKYDTSICNNAILDCRSEFLCVNGFFTVSLFL